MARKKRAVEAPKRASSPPAASLSDEEEEEEEPQQQETVQNDSAEEEDPNEDEEMESPAANPTVTPLTPTKSKNSGAESDSDDASSESTQPSPSLSAFTIKPITPRRPPPKPEPEKPSNKKRKESSSTYNGGAIQRLWSEDDEIELLKGMARFRSERGMDPNLVMNAFHDFIKGSLSVEIAKNQLVNKIKRLKKKYVDNRAKGENGNDPVLTNPHDIEAFELSKKVWGDGSRNAAKVRVKIPSKDNDPGGDGGGGVSRSVTLALPCGGGEAFGLSKIKERKMKPEKKALSRVVKMNVEEDEGRDVEEDAEEEDAEVEENVGECSWEREFPFLSEGLEMKGLTEGVKEMVRKRIREAGDAVQGKVKGLERKWKRLKRAELELFVKRTELIAEQVKLALDIIKSD